jgi:predicted DNA-binding protein (UPF0251 family)
MKPWIAGLVCTVFAAGAWPGEEGLRIPSSGSGPRSSSGAEGTTVHYPFGNVLIPSASLGKEKTDVVSLGKRHATTLGTFRVRYTLAREIDGMVARQVRVRVENKENYFSPATAKLREHEAMHGRINTAEAVRLQDLLGKFKTGETNPAKAEKLFQAAFRTHIEAVKKLHADWDENHVFIQPEKGKPWGEPTLLHPKASSNEDPSSPHFLLRKKPTGADSP